MGMDFAQLHPGTMTKAEYDRYVENSGHSPYWPPEPSHRRRLTVAATADTVDRDASATMIA